VNDLRTSMSTSNTGCVLDGDLDEFMQAALAQKAFGAGLEMSRAWVGFSDRA